MGYMNCELCKTGRILVDYGPVCRDCENAADKNTIEGAVLLAYMTAQRSDDCGGDATHIAELLEPFVLGPEPRNGVELYMALVNGRFAARTTTEGLSDATEAEWAGVQGEVWRGLSEDERAVLDGPGGLIEKAKTRWARDQARTEVRP